MKGTIRSDSRESQWRAQCIVLYASCELIRGPETRDFWLCPHRSRAKCDDWLRKFPARCTHVRRRICHAQRFTSEKTLAVRSTSFRMQIPTGKPRARRFFVRRARVSGRLTDAPCSERRALPNGERSQRAGPGTWRGMT
ncbi:hypothetical protein PsYK624_026700 [Phanerochaete sordida]|uniref:Uncharacterized protein n=1 Tax=Phanerochaete sordida TaxID=48140 RepID=A0A9P3L8Y9_9APHY|nr:hypothetical protein PsYK624_026700 [Phanerochaete sordida]